MGDKYAIKLIKYQYSDLLEYSNLEKHILPLFAGKSAACII